MNLQAAYDISSKATAVLDKTLGEAQLLLARKKKERDDRVAGFKSIITIMESELENADAEIEALEKIVHGPAPADDVQSTDHKLAGSTLMLNGHTAEAAE